MNKGLFGISKLLSMFDIQSREMLGLVLWHTVYLLYFDSESYVSDDYFERMHEKFIDLIYFWLKRADGMMPRGKWEKASAVMLEQKITNYKQFIIVWYSYLHTQLLLLLWTE